MYKKNDPLDLANWRPITLLNIDYKIAAHCFAQRIKPILPKIFSTDQNGFIKTKRRRSDLVLWQKPLHQQKCQKGQVTTQTTLQKCSIKQQLRTDLGRSVGVTTATQLVWLTWFTSPPSISPQQPCIGRNISYSIRLIQDIIDYAEKFEVQGSILFLDFAKAFGTLEWNFMFTTLEYFGFNNSFTQWAKTMYNNKTCKVTNNGWISAPLTISRGIRQWCPLSSLLFVITVETMAARIYKTRKRYTRYNTVPWTKQRI